MRSLGYTNEVCLVLLEQRQDQKTNCSHKEVNKNQGLGMAYGALGEVRREFHPTSSSPPYPIRYAQLHVMRNQLLNFGNHPSKIEVILRQPTCIMCCECNLDFVVRNLYIWMMSC